MGRRTETPAGQQLPGEPDRGFRGSEGKPQEGHAHGKSGGVRAVTLQLPAALHEGLRPLIESSGFADVTDLVIQLLRDEVDRDEFDNGMTGYSKREVELIRKLLHHVDCSD